MYAIGGWVTKDGENAVVLWPYPIYAPCPSRRIADAYKFWCENGREDGDMIDWYGRKFEIRSNPR